MCIVLKKKIKLISKYWSTFDVLTKFLYWGQLEIGYNQSKKEKIS